jgi:hypothetical protein
MGCWSPAPGWLWFDYYACTDRAAGRRGQTVEHVLRLSGFTARLEFHVDGTVAAGSHLIHGRRGPGHGSCRRSPDGVLNAARPRHGDISGFLTLP